MVGCGTSGDEANRQPGMNAQAKTIEPHFNELLQRQNGAFLVISLPGDALMIQFTGSSQEPIVADLPLKWIDDQELTTARKIFVDHGATQAQLPDRNATDLFPSLQVDLGSDTQKAAVFAADVLEQVYGVSPDEQLVFETESD